MNIWKLQAPKS